MSNKMFQRLLKLTLAVAALWLGLSGGSSAFDSPNVLLICIDDLRPELNCYGVHHMITPNLDKLASEGVAYSRHFVQAPTCGASRYALLTGCYGPSGNGALFSRAKRLEARLSVPTSMPEWFRDHGYTTVSVGKVSHHPGGHGGPDWNDPKQLEMPNAWDRTHLPIGNWQHPRGWMHGLANGKIRLDPSKMPVFEHAAVEDDGYPDGVTVAQATEELAVLKKAGRPFFLAVGLLRPHLPLGAPEKDYAQYKEVDFSSIKSPNKPNAKSTWHRSNEFMKYNRQGRDPNTDQEFATDVRRHYAACVTFADRQVGKILGRLKELQLNDNTIVVVWGDHGWHLGEHAIWGKHSLFEQSLLSPLIIRQPMRLNQDLDSKEPANFDNSIVETIDVFPSLCQLCNLPVPPSCHGKPLPGLKIVSRTKSPDRDLDERWASAISYTPKARTIRTDRYRLIVHHDGYIELYDHHSDPTESQNVTANNPEQADKLLGLLNDRWARTNKE